MASSKERGGSHTERSGKGVMGLLEVGTKYVAATLESGGQTLQRVSFARGQGHGCTLPLPRWGGLAGPGPATGTPLPGVNVGPANPTPALALPF